MARSKAPWTEAEVANLRAWQAADEVPQFTAEDGTNLVPAADGWRHKSGGDVVQDWAHDFMLNGLALRNARETVALLTGRRK